MIVITGATGNTGKPAVEALLAKGEKVRVLGRDGIKLKPLADAGAEPFVANVEDAASLSKAFEGATAAYLVVPQNTHVEDFRAYQERVTDAYASAVASSRVPYLVTLSSTGAQHSEKIGPIVGLHNMETKLNRIQGLNVLHVRAADFMDNLLLYIQPIRTMGVLPGGSPGDMPFSWIATKDVGNYAAGRLNARDFSGVNVQELVGPRDITLKEVASIIGKSIGKPTLGYTQVPFMMLEPAMVQIGMHKKTAALIIEMIKANNAGMRIVHEARSPANTTTTTMESFATAVFTPAYKAQAAKA
jgi:uncharacterized protein YbjT (DUF2867 family)